MRTVDYSQAVTICEVGPRDGFQMEAQFIPTDRKIEIINRLSGTGLREIQVTSFVHPGAIPQLSDAETVFARISRTPGIRYSALIPNLRGAQRAIRAEVDAMDIVVSATDSHSLSNTNVTTTEAMNHVESIINLAHKIGIEVTIGFATALGCPFEGVPPYQQVEALVRRAVEDYAIGRVLIADTVGMASPRLVYETMRTLRETFSSTLFSLHLHDTRRMGLANLVAGLEAGIANFDSSIAGLGGCPYAPGATGNIATEDALNLLHEMDVPTGVDLSAVLDVSGRVSEVVGRTDSGVHRAGPSTKTLGRFTGRQAKLSETSAT